MTKNLGESVLREGSAPPPRALRVLIADDDRDSVLMLMMLFRHEGDAVRGVYSGRNVMEAVEDFDPDVLLLDIDLPGLSGWEVARKLRQTRGEVRPMLIGISGEYKLTSDRVLSTILGFNDYLVKPYEFSDLLALIAPLRSSEPQQKRA